MAWSRVVGVVLLSVVVIVPPVARTAKILLVPLGINSHVVFFGQLGIGLKGEGHDVSLIVPTHAKVGDAIFDAGVEVIQFKGEEEQFVKSKGFNEVMIKIARTESFLEMLIISLQLADHPHIHWARDCEAMLNDTALMTKVEETKYDFAIMDTIFPPCIYTLPYKFGIPHAGFGIPVFLLNYRVPGLPSAVPSSSLKNTDRMTFFQRVGNVLLAVLEQVLGIIMIQKDFVSRYAPEKPYLSPSELHQQSKLQFYLTDPIMGFPMPSMPNTEFIGDIMGRPARPLEPWLEDLVSNASKGVVLVSMGTMMASVPEDVSHMIFEALGNLDQVVLMKKAGRIPEKVAENIHLMDWLPQNDLLGHDKVKVFVTHCGLNSLIETVYHGKPIVGVPMVFDQPYNGFIAETKGLGRVIHFANLSALDLQEAIEDVFTVSKYSEQARRLSRAFRDKPQPAAARASFLINHVIRHGDDHLRTGAFELNIFQFLLLDVLLFFLFIIVVGLYCCFRCSRFCCGKCCRKRGSKIKKE